MGISKYSEKGLSSIRNSIRNGFELSPGVNEKAITNRLLYGMVRNIPCSPVATLILLPNILFVTRFSSILPTVYSGRVRQQVSHRFLYIKANI
jgi:hypothetical protein